MSDVAAMPTAAEAAGWIGAALSDVSGSRVGEVRGLYLDAAGGEPAWLVVKLGRRRRARVVAVPLRDCAGAAFGAWTAHPVESLRAAPLVDPARPLLRDHELAICAHYGIGESVGRAAEVAGRPESAITAVPA